MKYRIIIIVTCSFSLFFTIPLCSCCCGSDCGFHLYGTFAIQLFIRVYFIFFSLFCFWICFCIVCVVGFFFLLAQWTVVSWYSSSNNTPLNYCCCQNAVKNWNRPRIVRILSYALLYLQTYTHTTHNHTHTHELIKFRVLYFFLHSVTKCFFWSVILRSFWPITLILCVYI